MRRAAAYALDRRALAAVYAERPSDHLVPAAVAGAGANIAYQRAPTSPPRAASPVSGTGARRPCTTAAHPTTSESRRSFRREPRRDRDRRAHRPIARVPDRPQTEATRSGRPGAGLALRRRRDPAPFVDFALGDAYTVRGLRGDMSSRRQVERAGATRGPAYTGLSRLERCSCAMPCPSRSTPGAVDPEFFSARVGCIVSQGGRFDSPILALSACIADQAPAAMLQVKRVSCSRGARPAGRAPRRTTSVDRPPRAARAATSPGPLAASVATAARRPPGRTRGLDRAIGSGICQGRARYRCRRPAGSAIEAEARSLLARLHDLGRRSS